MKYLKSSLLYTVYVIASLSIGFVFATIPLYISRGFGATVFTQNIVSVFSTDMIAMIVLFKVMYDNGYKKNTTYNNKPWKELFIGIAIVIPIYVMISLISDVVWIIRFFTLNSLNIMSLIVSEYQNIYEIKASIDNYYNLLVLSSIIQILTIIPSMIIGFCCGFKTRQRIRDKM